MKSKISRFIQAFRMNGEVKRRTLLIGGVALTLIVVIVLAICILIPNSPAPVEPEEEVVDDAVVPEIEFEPIVEPEDMEEIMKKYPDVYAWLEIPGTSAVLGTNADVSYPVAQHPSERLFYLNHDLDGNSYQPGVLFTEAVVEDRPANGKDLNDPVTIIYGHNQANRTMFGGLQTYMSKMKFGEDQKMYLYQKDRRVTYQIIGGVQYETRHILYYHDFTNENVFNDFFSMLWAETDPSTNVDPDNQPVAGDRILILSVCKNGDDYHRYLVIGKMVEDTDELKAAAATAATAADQTAAPIKEESEQPTTKKTSQ